jgi:hypothetical protein
MAHLLQTRCSLSPITASLGNCHGTSPRKRFSVIISRRFAHQATTNCDFVGLRGWVPCRRCRFHPSRPVRHFAIVVVKPAPPWCEIHDFSFEKGQLDVLTRVCIPPVNGNAFGHQFPFLTFTHDPPEAVQAVVSTGRTTQVQGYRPGMTGPVLVGFQASLALLGNQALW